MSGPFRLLEQLYADPVSRAIWSADGTLQAWLRTEAALARAQARAGLLNKADAEAIAAACDPAGIEAEQVWEAARNVGYPILGLVRAVADRLPEGPDGRVHYGATTQDIMDTGLALQLVASCDHLASLVAAAGDAVAVHVSRHEATVMAARTHAQQAVPTTFGAKLATYLSQLTDCLARLCAARELVAVVSLHGAGGTNAAMAPHGGQVRRLLASELGLQDPEVPWHVTRHRVVDFALACSVTAAVCVRFAREVVDLARNEIGEVQERAGHHRGASSTMPQKANPITAEAIIGFGIAAEAEGAGLIRTIEAGHERSAGEWQAEWVLLPQVVEHTASALALLRDLVSTLGVDAQAMRRNLEVDGGLLMSEAVMFRLAPEVGRERAHDVVYEAAHGSRRSGRPFLAELTAALDREGRTDVLDEPVTPESYLGEARQICRAATTRWAEATTIDRDTDRSTP
jgi:3-carboxy-cis,cis-muconate cycloisomerase